MAVMKTRGSLFVKKANADFFNPRGLKVELATSKVVKVKLDLSPDLPLAAPVAVSGHFTAVERMIAGL